MVNGSMVTLQSVYFIPIKIIGVLSDKVQGRVSQLEALKLNWFLCWLLHIRNAQSGRSPLFIALPIDSHSQLS